MMKFENRTGMELAAVSSNKDMAEPNRLEEFLGHRSLLISIAYRMLGSWADAEDILQEAFIRWQQTSEIQIESPKAFLVTIVSRLCINHLQSARVKREEYFGEWLPEPLLTAPAHDPSEILQIDESLSMAFLVLLERLTPVQRAIFLLREVFDYEYSEIAAIVGKSESNCRQILRRAQKHVAENRPRFEPSRRLREQLLQQFIQASSRGDMEGLLALLSSDAVFHSDGGGKAAAVPNRIYGSEKVARMLLGASKKFTPGMRRWAEINGQPGFVRYLNGRPFSVVTVDIADGRIHNIYVITNPEKLQRLPLVDQLAC
jgi:RNA polymerase sigma-70 factor (ECF subfamily)